MGVPRRPAVPGQDLAHQPYGAYLSTWAARFATVGFELIDPFRGVVWNDDRVPFWFRQNLVLFVAKDYLAEHPALLAAAAAHSSAARPVDVIHPELYDLLAGTGPDASLRLTLLRVPRILAAKVPKVRTRLRRFYRRGRATASA